MAQVLHMDSGFPGAAFCFIIPYIYKDEDKCIIFGRI